MKRVSDIAFSPAVKRAQAARGSRQMYEAATARRDFGAEITDDLAAFIAERDSFYISTASAAGQPYVQHRGGPKGFLQVVDRRTLAFADYSGNRQYITVGNLDENPRAFLFLMDYPNRRRVKLWGVAKVTDEPSRQIIFTVAAWDRNCPQHILPRYSAEEWRARSKAS